MSADNFFAGADIYILMGEEWTSMQTMAEVVLSKLGDKYTAVITATEAVSGDKVRRSYPLICLRLLHWVICRRE